LKNDQQMAWLKPTMNSRKSHAIRGVAHERTDWSKAPVVFVTVPTCPGCGSRQYHRTRTDANGDGSATRKVICRACVADRQSAIGDPKLEFLPAHREKITSELLGMFAKWKETGMPLDFDVRHPFSLWAKTIGGILKANGFADFLANYGKRRAHDDPIKHGLAIMGAARPGEWLRPGEWAEVMVECGLTKTLIESHERDTDAGRMRALGVLMTVHLDEVFEAETESDRLRLRLKVGRPRLGGEPLKRYCFEELQRVALPVEGDQQEVDSADSKDV
jgi:hypothetical protein